MDGARAPSLTFPFAAAAAAAVPVAAQQPPAWQPAPSIMAAGCSGCFSALSGCILIWCYR